MRLILVAAHSVVWLQQKQYVAYHTAVVGAGWLYRESQLTGRSNSVSLMTCKGCVLLRSVREPLGVEESSR